MNFMKNIASTSPNFPEIQNFAKTIEFLGYFYIQVQSKYF